MTPNKTTIEAYMDGFRKTDRPQILSCLTNDVEWVIPGAFHVRAKDDFAKHIDEGFIGPTAWKWAQRSAPLTLSVPPDRRRNV